MRWDEHVARMVRMINSWNVVGICEKDRPGDDRPRLLDNTTNGMTEHKNRDLMYRVNLQIW